ncbi:uncharacterized protein EV420DRAFT_1222489, partial [Desarmillaria tabescens]
LQMSPANKLGNGSHSKVYKGRLSVPNIPFTGSPTGDVTVAVKIALSDDASLGMLADEAKVYQSLPRYLKETWSGYHYMEEAEYDGSGINPLPAVVPQFYGYYVPEDPKDREVYSPLLLMEECGKPIQIDELESCDRELIFSFVVRLQHAGFIQGSITQRNILVQPGPLSARPTERSLSTPSFRIIDFGR